MERRNPYLVLGIMFGATPDEAREALARRLKAVRADDDSAARQDGLRAALRQIESGPQPAASGLTPYRVPADPDALAVTGSGLFAPPVEPSFVTDSDVALALRGLQVAAAHEHLLRLVEGRAESLGAPAA
jgi:hypothetical protein